MLTVTCFFDNWILKIQDFHFFKLSKSSLEAAEKTKIIEKNVLTNDVFQDIWE